MKDENRALLEQATQLRTEVESLHVDVTRLKASHADQISRVVAERDNYKDLSDRRESEIIFLEDHARFSTEQTKLSISHWDLLLKNRDENIELLTSRINQLSSETRLSPDVTLDKFRCMQDRVAELKNKYRALKEKYAEALSDEDGREAQDCPWRHQADVRVAQLERVTSQLNATYEQLHTKSDELLLQNRELGSLRRKIFDSDAKLKKYRLKVARLRDQLANLPPARSPETSSFHSSE
jgi:hypothetical protein